jgi:hypothetical protein
MPHASRQLTLNLFIYPGGHHEAAWRYRDSEAHRLTDIRFYQELAQSAEAAKLDAIFFADGPVLADNIRYASRFRGEPLTWLTAIAVATSRIGLIGTASTSYTATAARAGTSSPPAPQAPRATSIWPDIRRTPSGMSGRGNFWMW